MIGQLLGRLKTGLKAAMGFRYDALDLLRSDHMKVESLAVRLRLSKDVGHRKELLAQIRTLLDRHMRLEEEVFYPACARIDRLRALVDHAHTDHQLARNALKDLAVMDPAYDRFDELVTTLIKAFEHHVREEEGRMFAGARLHMYRREFEEMNRRVLEARAAEEREEKAA